MTGNLLNRDPAEQRLTALRTELLARGIESRLVTSGIRPRLHIEIPGLSGGWADSLFEDNVIAAQCPKGQWWYWWPWIEKLGPAGDPADAAQVLANQLRGCPDREQPGEYRS